LGKLGSKFRNDKRSIQTTSFNHGVLKAMRENDEKVMGSFAESLFQSGSSEIKNWIGAAGALEHLSMELLNYAPAYRSAAGTGCGLAFAQWL
jgi:3-O-methylgallate 3,4-dioxygenase